MYVKGDEVWVRTDSLSDRYPAKIEQVLEEEYQVLWQETDQHVVIPKSAVVGLQEIPDDACCANEDRNMNGGCNNCGAPCL